MPTYKNGEERAALEWMAERYEGYADLRDKGAEPQNTNISVPQNVSSFLHQEFKDWLLMGQRSGNYQFPSKAEAVDAFVQNSFERLYDNSQKTGLDHDGLIEHFQEEFSKPKAAVAQLDSVVRSDQRTGITRNH